MWLKLRHNLRAEGSGYLFRITFLQASIPVFILRNMRARRCCYNVKDTDAVITSIVRVSLITDASLSSLITFGDIITTRAFVHVTKGSVPWQLWHIKNSTSLFESNFEVPCYLKIKRFGRLIRHLQILARRESHSSLYLTCETLSPCRCILDKHFNILTATSRSASPTHTVRWSNGNLLEFRKDLL